MSIYLPHILGELSHEHENFSLLIVYYKLVLRTVGSESLKVPPKSYLRKGQGDCIICPQQGRDRSICKFEWMEIKTDTAP